MSIIWEVFIDYITNSDLRKVTELVENNQVDASDHDNQAIIWAASNGHLEVIKYLLTLPGVKASAQKNKAFIWAIIYGQLEVVKYLSTLPNVDAYAKDTQAIIDATFNGHLEILEYLLTLPGVDASADDNYIIQIAAADERLSIVAMLLYFEPKVALSLSDKKQYNRYSNLLLCALRPVVYKIAVALVELPTPILIEIIEQAIDFGIYMPYHIKWNMVVAIKHNNCRKN